MDILCVDDSKIARRLLQIRLEQIGHDVTLANSGEEGWELYQEKKPPVIITDWMMPDIDGLELTRRIRSTPMQRYTYIILLTAKGGTASFVAGLDAGADDFITKPFEPDELAARLRVAERIVGLHSHVRQLESLLPICSYCKKIRVEDEAAGPEGDDWLDVEAYLTDKTQTTLSHGVCPSCYQEQMGRIQALKRQNQGR